MGRVLVALCLFALAACGSGNTDSLSGEELFVDIGCQGCHTDVNTGVAPTLEGVWGSEVLLSDGRTVTADDAYVRKSIKEPGADIVDGFSARMPTFSLSDSEVDRLVDYVRSLG